MMILSKMQLNHKQHEYDYLIFNLIKLITPVKVYGYMHRLKRQGDIIGMQF